MNVTFRSFGDHIASSRLRALVPQRELAKIGVPQGSDWLVIGKHWWTWQETRGFGRVCFDVCDDHFDSPQLGSHYRESCQRADLVTCNSAEMARVITAKTGRQAVVIPDPFEQPETPARIGPQLLWFGHRSNLVDLEPWKQSLAPLEIVTNISGPGYTLWTPHAMDAAFERSGLVVIPTGKSLAKSGNRAIEAIRRGLYVVAGYLPAYADLGMWCGDIAEGVDWALSNQPEALRRVTAAQAYVRQAYSPQRIAQLWLQALSATPMHAT